YFHPDAVAIAPLLFAYWAARARRWGWFAVAAVLAVACKEDTALVVAVLGLVIAIRGNLRIGATTTALAGIWYLVATRLLMKSLLGGLDPFYNSFFGDLGNSFGSVVRNSVLRPGTTLDLVSQSDRLSYYWRIFCPVGFLCFLAPSTLLLAVPMLAVNALTTFPYARVYMYHYSALVVAGVVLATVEAIAWAGRSPKARRVLVGAVAATTLGTTVAWGPSPISVLFDDGYWPLSNDPRVALQRRALSIIPDDASVSAIYTYVPHLTHRPEIYDFPEPWVHVNWGVRGEGLPDAATVDWIALDLRLMSVGDGRLLDVLLEREFATRFNEDNVVVAERIAPG
ncbi:MAG: DUF2079 domain-containing protein, partial [Actinomycetota bacterium]|nr:DUF2079 domain-containing protein [Actinomycetota bacterium]